MIGGGRTGNCECADGYYDDGINALCISCANSNCQTCSNSSTNCGNSILDKLSLTCLY